MYDHQFIQQPPCNSCFSGWNKILVSVLSEKPIKITNLLKRPTPSFGMPIDADFHYKFPPLL